LRRTRDAGLPARHRGLPATGRGNRTWKQLTDMPTPDEIQAAAFAIERAIINRLEWYDEPTVSMLIEYAQAALEAAEQVRAGTPGPADTTNLNRTEGEPTIFTPPWT
jgi:hypothetical protein